MGRYEQDSISQEQGPINFHNMEMNPRVPQKQNFE